MPGAGAGQYRLSFAENRTATFSEISVKNPLAVIFRTCVAGAFAMLLSAHASAGVVFRGAIDPDFGLGITGLTYTGLAIFDVSPDCLDVSQDGTHDPNGDSCGGMSLTSATITLKNGSATEILNFGDPVFTPTQPITSFEIFAGTLASVDTVAIGPRFATAEGLGYTGPLWLELFTTFTNDGDFRVPVPHADLITNICPESNPDCIMGAHTEVADVQITQVPEPTIIALLLAALSACWFGRLARDDGADVT
jgi:hypothetical protein